MDATRARIIEAATELYIELGISGTTMRRVAARADVARGCQWSGSIGSKAS